MNKKRTLDITFVKVHAINFQGLLSALSIIMGIAQSPSKHKIEIINTNIIVKSGPRRKDDNIFLNSVKHIINKTKNNYYKWIIHI